MSVKTLEMDSIGPEGKIGPFSILNEPREGKTRYF